MLQIHLERGFQRCREAVPIGERPTTHGRNFFVVRKAVSEVGSTTRCTRSLQNSSGEFSERLLPADQHRKDPRAPQRPQRLGEVLQGRLEVRPPEGDLLEK